ncbi:tyrosinase family protein [Zhouia spongiae]|uniref:Tyrosinase family protein n=1 Tax=Zhouia spongiae TaxID=2202721 RepID=A0ABY3YKR9_9FLAO|nr:tyrosinase family protein [Zhouia spongiae]UNY98404.1 tyrosinase family protein [Zhouia spongiae]
MKLFCKILALQLLFFTQFIFSQSIRKNYTEMTQAERDALVNAFYQLRNGPDLIDDLATFHSDFFSFDNTSDPTRLDIHFNLPDEAERDIFFAWHRAQMFEVEQAMQDIDPNISIPYWNSIVDQSVNSPLWDENFMGQFDDDWSLNRNLGANGQLGTVTEYNTLMGTSDYLIFSNDAERGNIHAGPHRWTGGFMPTTASPRDPIFYLHHTFIDKVWADWEEIHQNSSFILTSMLRYDGTYVFDGEALPLVNPNDITDPRAFGVFYAEDGLAVLDNYTVSNTYNDIENFYYQFLIEVRDNFVVPSNTNCQITSVNEVALLPGFVAESGSELQIRIDNTQSRSLNNPIVRNTKKFGDLPSLRLVSDILKNEPKSNSGIEVFPVPFKESLNINLESVSSGTIMMFNLAGQMVRSKEFKNTKSLHIRGLGNLATGSYILNVVNESGMILHKVQLIKS